MKKEFIKPKTTIYNVQIAKMVALSIEDGGGQESLDDDDFGEGGNFEIDARSGNNRGNVWDNAW